MPLATEILGFAPAFSDYRRTWDLQKKYHEDVLAGTRESTILLLEHPPVYTAGKRTEDHERPTDGTEVVSRRFGRGGTEAAAEAGRAGVWILGDGVRRDRKIGAIGIRIHEGVTMHGLALNCSNDLGAYASIIPCGITDADTTTISAELGRTVTPEEVAPRLDEILHETITA